MRTPILYACVVVSGQAVRNCAENVDDYFDDGQVSRTACSLWSMLVRRGDKYALCAAPKPARIFIDAG